MRADETGKAKLARLEPAAAAAASGTFLPPEAVGEWFYGRAIDNPIISVMSAGPDAGALNVVA